MSNDLYTKCHDCKEEIGVAYSVDLGFLGTIEVCEDCLGERGLVLCYYCGEIYDHDDIIYTQEDYKCRLCVNDSNKENDQ